ncbi:sensor histidine kinase [Shewanella yunxiaonensis]|uniref:histidine kinase n=1 Tax=Shewanella yunxiaonensis TaxID=2829809 RepID=A0ABX7YW85_9GAMM|nr:MULTISPECIES: ATP-binding protein [Shewanella]MDF0535695.1 ATP-binding protein [Shewanella sp. A32]QUN06972.1 sensor histidine kinase [Shewanella yunxiaonensis]
MQTQSSPRKRLLISILLIAGLIAMLKLTYWYHLEQGFSRALPLANRQLEEVINFIDGALIRYESIPHVLSTNPLLAKALKLSNDSNEIKHINRYFEEIQHVTEASDIYLLNQSGDAVAASNWQKPYSFIGQNYAFRPYYTEAMAGRLGSYYAVGTSSDTRGFYFSYPIQEKGEVLGVIVVKVDIADIEEQLTGLAKSGQYELAISGDDQVIFVASMDSWRLKSLVPLDENSRQAIYQSRRYANRIITALTVKPPYSPFEHSVTAPIYQIPTDDGKAQYIDSRSEMTKAGWNVHVMTPVKPLYSALPPLLMLSACLYLLAALGLLFSLERRKNMQRMQLAQQLLEHRVQERTQELQDANDKLQETQDELVQAAKLTVIGSLSASINHEINQPLAALRSYAQNTQILLSRNMQDKAQENLTTIISLADRLADIVSQFKSFTRKNKGQDKLTDIRATVEDALTIVTPEIEKQHVELQIQIPDTPLRFFGDKVRLQQVLVNLISNAITAMQQSVERRLNITISAGDQLCIEIRDSGPGVNESQMEKIFEPYFTTSQRQGLGLGLSISRRIVESMNGSITVANAASGGAEFKILLPLCPAEEHA